ncbi:N-(5'-phosphoribosyl)anthranilate isomerase [Reticulibacter mediterranei]|uniref:N-(5'-phosphoribosyl)anthranilate isomerase n=1 Tax=Reticulibacter mediterranei TaxID=2778369 RepID=A0A8J3IJS6_9CHLR|nr:phosphoribosylanthranilate isomerase [Reticulibacter mediterranei]GHO92734.1 N-(5'-phosphoribosyl)anthranilate isomerase [Reticulibacter mediterranei]
MEAITRPRIKICCISSVQEAHLAIRYGASALGLVSAMPSGPGIITEEEIARIAETIPPAIASFLLTSQQDVDNIITQQRRCRVNTIQLVDSLPEEGYPRLREALPGIALVQVIHVRGLEALDEARRIAPYVHALLLDSGNPTLAVKELGGTGRVHDWEVSRIIREAVDVPVFLAGGLKAQNIREAIQRVGAFGLDLCSGVRTNGRLDESKLAQFFQNMDRQ